MPPIVLQNWEAEFKKWIPVKERHVIQLRKISKFTLLAFQIGGYLFSWCLVNTAHFTSLLTTSSVSDGKTTTAARLKVMREWYRKGGVFLLGYSLFRDFCMGKGKDTESGIQFQNLLQAETSLVIADEGHLLKNVTVSVSLW